MVTKNQKNQEKKAISEGLYRFEQDKSALYGVFQQKIGSGAMASFQLIDLTTFLGKSGQINAEKFASNFLNQNCTDTEYLRVVFRSLTRCHCSCRINHDTLQKNTSS